MIRYTASPISKEILLLAASGKTVKEIISFRSENFPNGFGISSVNIWRRVRKAILRAGMAGIIAVDPDRLPFPAALRFRKKETLHGSSVVLNVRMDTLLSAIRRRDWSDVEFQYDRVLRAIHKMEEVQQFGENPRLLRER